LQVPDPHVTLAMLLEEQLLPQAPQFRASLPTFTSQPLVRLFASQSTKPALHGPVQLPLEHWGTRLFDEQAASHAPQ